VVAAERERRAHRIGRLVFDLDGSAPGVEALAARLDAAVADEIARALETACDRAVPAGDTIWIDRLVIDLDPLRADGDGLAKTLGEAVATALGAVAPATARAPVSDPVSGETAFAALARFLQTGHPGVAGPGALDDLAAALSNLSDAAFARGAAGLASRLRHAEAARRLARQMPLGVLVRLLRALAARAGADGASGQRQPIENAERFLPEPAATQVATTIAALAETVAAGQRDAAGGNAASRLIRAIAAGQVAAADFPEPVRPGRAIKVPRDEESASGPEPDPEARQGLPVVHAGLVLLHPFLPRIFAALGLLEDAGAFRSPEAPAQAAMICHALATGTVEAEEPDLTVPRLLCGLPSTISLPRAPAMPARWRDEAEGLLQAVIGHWPALGRTTPDGLRTGFLQRAGVLEPGPAGPRLAVEASGIDVLLDRLPWPLSQVRTPFMATVLTVDWR